MKHDYRTFWKIERPIYAQKNLAPRDAFTPGSRHGLYERLHVLLNDGQSLALLCAPQGYGKSTLVQSLLQDIPASTHEVAFIDASTANNEADWLMGSLATFFGCQAEEQQKRNHSVLQAFDDIVTESRKLVIVIENAESLQSETRLTDIEKIINIQANSQYFATIIMLGDDRTKALVKSAHALSRRVDATIDLPALTEADISAFLSERLVEIGIDHQVFSRAAISAIHGLSDGAFSTVCTLSEHCLMEAAQQDTRQVVVKTVLSAANYVIDEQKRDSYTPPQDRTKITLRGPRHRTESELSDISEQDTNEQASTTHVKASPKLAVPTSKILLADLVKKRQAG